MNATGTQLLDLINSGLARWRMAVKCRPDDVPYVLPRIVCSNLQYQAAAEIGARGGGNIAVRGGCKETPHADVLRQETGG